MDGIPVKISEKYKPPRKYTLPGCILNRINSDIKTEPYNFNLERSVLEHLEHLKEVKSRYSEKRQIKRDDWLSKTKTKDPPEDESCPLDLNSQVPAESTMLKPVPISTNCRIEPIRKEGQINLSDFENESSPFDSVELKTINEMEELAHVLGGTSIDNTTFNTMKNPSNSNVHLPNGYTSQHWGTTPGNYAYPGVYGTTSNSGTTITLPSPHVSTDPYNYLHSTNDTLYNCNSVYSSTARAHLPHSYNMTQSNTTLHHKEYADNSYRQQISYYSNQTPLITQLPSNTPSSSTATTHTYVSSTNNTLHKSYKPLHSYIPTNSSTVNVHLPTISSSLTQDHTSNLTTIRTPSSPKKKDDDGVSKILDDLRKQVLLRKQELQPIPPAPVISELSRSSKPSVSRLCDSEQINPLNHLSLQSQEFAKNMAEMGFPLARVARAIQQFGADEAKVIEFLLQVQSLKEKHYPEEQIEKALLLHNFKEDEAANYLENLNQIMKLGFKEEEVELALTKSSNNRDKALDILIS